MPFGAEDLPRELGQRAFQVGHGDVAVDGQPFDLMEHPLVRGVLRLVAVDATRHDDAHRRRRLLHHACLHRGGMRPQHDLARAVRRWIVSQTSRAG